MFGLSVAKSLGAPSTSANFRPVIGASSMSTSFISADGSASCGPLPSVSMNASRLTLPVPLGTSSSHGPVFSNISTCMIIGRPSEPTWKMSMRAVPLVAPA